jgi:dimethylargininase
VADRAKALAQHRRLKDLLQCFGADVIDVPELANHPNSVFTRDTAVCTPEGYIRLLPGIDSRADEGRWMAAILDGLGEPCAGRINYPGTVDGGDVILCDRVAFVGRSLRSNAEGCRQISGYLQAMGYAVRIIDLPPPILHLDKVLMPVEPGRLLVCVDIVPESFLQGFDRIEIHFDHRSSANIICLGPGELIVGDANRDALQALAREKLTIHAVDVSEFIKGAGGPNCLIMPLARAGA